MAKDTKPAADSAERAVAPRKKKLLIIALAAVLLLVLAGGGALLFLKKGNDESADDEEVAEAPAKKRVKHTGEEHPVFVNLEPFTVNLVPEAGDQYLQVTLSIEFDEPTAEQLVKVHMPKIRNNVTLLLSGKKASELLTKEGKQNLAEELRDTVNDVLEPPRKTRKGKLVHLDDGPAKDVLFTSFIIQ